MGVTGVAAFSILALTVSLSLARPRIRGLRVEHAIAAGLGAFLSLALGIVPLDLVALAIRLLFFPILTIVSLMVITLIAEKAGLFELLSRSIAMAARGNGRRLFAYVFGCGAVTGMVFTNDAAVLIFTPLVFQLVEQVQGDSWTLRNKVPYYFAVLYVANLVGALVISNPINIVVSSIFHISFVEYAKWMLLPAAASVLVSFAGLSLVFRKDIPASFEWSPALKPQTGSRRLLGLCALVLSATLVGFFTESLTGIPTWLVAFGGAVILLGIYATAGDGKVGPILGGVSWDVLAFVVGIFVVVLGLRHAGMTHQVGLILSRLASAGIWSLTLGTSLIAAVFSSIMNNHPTADMMGWAIRDLSGPALQTKAMVFSALIGGDLGPKMLPIGSLAALIWFRLLRDRGVQVPYSLYIKIGIPVTLLAILASVLTLNAELALAARFLPH
ncbi:MAG TPA: ArsB/NhaD family transporter [Thermoanaerobaculia bacterium]|nr:ArsB/NhaD family transporter [Thermoanaerobaculia bacterium]